MKSRTSEILEALTPEQRERLLVELIERRRHRLIAAAEEIGAHEAAERLRTMPLSGVDDVDPNRFRLTGPVLERVLLVLESRHGGPLVREAV